MTTNGESAELAVQWCVPARVLAARFPDAPLQLAAADRRTLLATLARAGGSAGATYDGLIALEAKAHGRTLLTLDARARDIYRRLGAPPAVVA
jgi:predicted nuclease of predicted toxin-antitoxin system